MELSGNTILGKNNGIIKFQSGTMKGYLNFKNIIPLTLNTLSTLSTLGTLNNFSGLRPF
jgi:hypothetical protein